MSTSKVDEVPTAEAAKANARDVRALLEKSLTLAVFCAVFAIYGIWLQGSFLSVDARMLDVHQNVPVLIIALAAATVLVGGQFDLSVASMATLSAFLCIGLAINERWPFELVVVACLLCGTLGGLLNAFLVVRLKVDSFIATLGSGGAFVGFSAVYSGGAMLTPTKETGSLPAWFSGSDSLGDFGSRVPAPVLGAIFLVLGVWGAVALSRKGPFTRLPRAVAVGGAVIAIVVVSAIARIDSWFAETSWSIGVLLILTGVLWVTGAYTTFGRRLRATGANPRAASLAGVDTGRQITASFVISGILSAVAGILMAANLGAANPDMAVPYLLPAYAAAFLSTVIWSRGHVTFWGTVLGGIFVAWVAQGLIVGGLDFTWNSVVNGVVLVSAVALSSVLAQKR